MHCGNIVHTIKDLPFFTATFPYNHFLRGKNLLTMPKTNKSCNFQ